MLKQLAPICLVGAGQEVIWICVGMLGPLREHTEAFLVLILASFVFCIWSFLHLRVASRQAPWLVVCFGLLFRLTLLPAPPYQSEDVYRYLWDARVASAGIDPFRYPPNAQALESVRDGKIYPMINSKPYITAYPPVSQILFRACYAVFGSSVAAMKTVFSIFEFGALLLSWRFLVLLKYDLRRLYLVAWNPFFIFEFSHSGHSDSAMMFFILLSAYFLWRKQEVPSMMSYAVAVLSKLHPALWVPLYICKVKWKAVAAALAVVTALSLPYFGISSGLRYARALGDYFRLFEFNASVHYLLRYIGRVVFHVQWDQTTGLYLGIVLLSVTALIVWRFRIRNGLDLLHAGFWILTADLCLATTVHPWYIAWAALALPFFPYAFMTYWTGACFVSYLAYAYRPVYEPAWSLLLEYLPMYGLMSLEILRRGPLLIRYLEETSQKSFPDADLFRK